MYGTCAPNLPSYHGSHPSLLGTPFRARSEFDWGGRSATERRVALRSSGSGASPAGSRQLSSEGKEQCLIIATPGSAICRFFSAEPTVFHAWPFCETTRCLTLPAFAASLHLIPSLDAEYSPDREAPHPQCLRPKMRRHHNPRIECHGASHHCGGRTRGMCFQAN
jgi:hypothetical protein